LKAKFFGVFVEVVWRCVLGTASGNVIALIIGGILLVVIIVYFITVPKYLHNLDKKITLLKEQLEKHKEVREH
jgi:F0F1-type ATP synthase membrane subunit b/b'